MTCFASPGHAGGGEGDARDFPSRAPSAPCVSRGIILNHTRSSRDIRSSTRRAPIFGTLARLYDCVRTEGPCHDPEIAELARPRCAVDGCRGGVPADAGSDLCAGARSARAAQRHHVVPGLRPARHDADHSGFWSDRPRWQQSARRKGRDLPVAGRGVWPSAASARSASTSAACLPAARRLPTPMR